MYNPISIAPLSESQILKALKGLPVRVSAGNQHDIALSAEQFKKFAKANQKGKASTITFDPFQIQNHMGLKGSGVLKKSARANAGRLITSATDRAIRAMSGSGYMQDMQVRLHQKDALKASDRYGLNSGGQYDDDSYYEYGIGGNIKAVGKDSGKRLIISGTDRAIRAIDGSGIGGNIKAVGKDSGKRLIISGTDRAIRAIDGSGIRQSFLSGTDKTLHTMTGSSVNRLKKAGRWEQFSNATLRDGIDTAGKAARVYYDSSNPMAQMGFGLKKRGRPRKSGGALYPAGVY